MGKPDERVVEKWRETVTLCSVQSLKNAAGGICRNNVFGTCLPPFDKTGAVVMATFFT